MSKVDALNDLRDDLCVRCPLNPVDILFHEVLPKADNLGHFFRTFVLLLKLESLDGLLVSDANLQSLQRHLALVVVEEWIGLLKLS